MPVQRNQRPAQLTFNSRYHYDFLFIKFFGCQQRFTGIHQHFVEALRGKQYRNFLRWINGIEFRFSGIYTPGCCLIPFFVF